MAKSSYVGDEERDRDSCSKEGRKDRPEDKEGVEDEEEEEDIGSTYCFRCYDGGEIVDCGERFVRQISCSNCTCSHLLQLRFSLVNVHSASYKAHLSLCGGCRFVSHPCK